MIPASSVEMIDFLKFSVGLVDLGSLEDLAAET